MASVLKPALGLGLLAWLLSELQWAELGSLWSRPGRAALWLGAACLFGAFGLIQPLRLHSVLRSYTGGLSGSFRLFAVGALFNNVLPSNVGGDAVRLAYLVRSKPGNWGAPLALLLLQRLSQLGVLLTIAAGCALADLPRLSRLLATRLEWRAEATAWPALVLGAAALAALGGALYRTRVGRSLYARAARAIAQARAGIGELGRGALLALLTHTLLFHALRVAGFWLLCEYAGTPVGWRDIVLVQAVTALAALLPLTVGGLGVMEGAIVGSLLVFGVPHPAGIAVALINRAALLPPAFAGAVVYALDRDRLAAAGERTHGSPKPGVEKPDTA